MSEFGSNGVGNLPPVEWIQGLPPDPKDAIFIMAEVKAEKDAADELLTDLNKKYDYLRFVHVPKCMEDQGIENIRLAGVGLIYLSPVLRARINKDRKKEAYEWLYDNGHADLITNTVNAQTLSSAVKEMMRKNEQFPKDLILVDALTQATIRRS